MGTESFPQLLFDKVFKDDVVRLRSMEDMWKTRRPPEPLDYSATAQLVSQDAVENILKEGQRVWDLQENISVFKDRYRTLVQFLRTTLTTYSLERLSKRMAEMKASGKGDTAEPTITFDKDDEDTLDFVTAGANLRSIVFGIETKSRFDIKQMAGNIIPAIATTNAIVAGLCVLQSYKVLRGEFTSTKEVCNAPFFPRSPSNLRTRSSSRRLHLNDF